MDLTEQLNELRQQIGKEVPREILREIGRFVRELAAGGIEETSSQAGQRAPSFSLPNVSGKIVSSEDILAKGPMVLSFYRGGW